MANAKISRQKYAVLFTQAYIKSLRNLSILITEYICIYRQNHEFHKKISVNFNVKRLSCDIHMREMCACILQDAF